MGDDEDDLYVQIDRESVRAERLRLDVQRDQGANRHRQAVIRRMAKDADERLWLLIQQAKRGCKRGMRQ